MCKEAHINQRHFERKEKPHAFFCGLGIRDDRHVIRSINIKHNPIAREMDSIALYVLHKYLLRFHIPDGISIEAASAGENRWCNFWASCEIVWLPLRMHDDYIENRMKRFCVQIARRIWMSQLKMFDESLLKSIWLKCCCKCRRMSQRPIFNDDDYIKCVPLSMDSTWKMNLHFNACDIVIYAAINYDAFGHMNG